MRGNRKRRNGNRPPTSLGPDDRGVTEVLAFVLVFGIILSSVAILSMTGFQAMNDYQENERLNNAERGMESLADNFNDVVRYAGIDQRYGELSLREGTVTTGDDGTEVTIEFDKPDDEEFERTYNLGEFAYEYDSETIAYEGGAVIRSSESGSITVTQPQVSCRDETAVVSLVKVDADDRSIQSSEGLGLTMSVEERDSTIHDVDDDFSIEVNPRAELDEQAWDRIESDWNDQCDDVEQVLITVVTVDIEY